MTLEQLKQDILAFVRTQHIDLTADQLNTFNRLEQNDIRQYAGVLKPTVGRELQALPDLIVLAISQNADLEKLAENLTLDSMRQMALLLSRVNQFI
jgi:hypothetical protein